MVNHTVQYSKSRSSPPARTAIGRPKDAGKRDDILAAASQLFLRDGFERTSMEAVAKKAAVSKLTIYSHFADKNALFSQVIVRRCNDLLQPESFADHMNQSAESGLTKLGMIFITYILTPDSIRLYRIMQAEALHHPQVVQAFYESGPHRVHAAFTELLQEWCHRQELAIADIPTAVGQFFSLIKGELMMRVMLRRGPVPDAAALRRHVRATVSMFLAAYRFPSSSLPKKVSVS